MLRTHPRRIATALSGTTRNTSTPIPGYHYKVPINSGERRVQEYQQKRRAARHEKLAVDITQALRFKWNGWKRYGPHKVQWRGVDGPEYLTLRTVAVEGGLQGGALDVFTMEAKRVELQGLIIRPPPGHQGRKHVELVRKFNIYIKLAARALYSDRLRKSVFYWFWKIKDKSPSLLECIPRATYHRLWKMHTAFRPLSSTRLKGMGSIVKAMERAGVDASHERAIFELEMKSDQGLHEEVIAEWKARFEATAKGQQRQKDWLEAGTRLYAAAGDLDGACHTLDRTIKSHQSTDPRFIFFLIWRHVETGKTARILKAWYLYNQLKKHPTFSLSADDYSSVFKCFLVKDHRRASLQVLKDIATDNDLVDPERRAPTLILCMRELHQSCKSIESLHNVSLSALQFFPKEVNLSPFFLSWLEEAHRLQGFDSSKLNRSKDSTDTCTQIIELMFESGQYPDPRHLNELIRVWFDLEGKAEEAESMAWSMINKRMALVGAKKEALSSSDGDHKLDRVPDFLKRPVPPAAAQTFTHLARHYVKGNQPDYAQYVLNLLASADLYLNSGSLRAILVIQFTLHEFAEAWQFYDKVRIQDPNSQNLFVYNTLWRGSFLHTRRTRDRFDSVVSSRHRYLQKVKRRLHEKEYPGVRDLFADMMTFASAKYPDPSQIDRKFVIPVHLYDRIIGGFMYAGDPIGAYIAMEALQHTLGLTPTPKTLKIILYYTSLEAQKAERKSGIEEHISHYKAMARGVLEYLYVNSDFHQDTRPRVAHLWSRKFVEDRGNDFGNVLKQYLKVLMAKYWGGEEVVQSYLHNARKMMGVDGLRLEGNGGGKKELEGSTVRKEVNTVGCKEHKKCFSKRVGQKRKASKMRSTAKRGAGE